MKNLGLILGISVALLFGFINSAEAKNCNDQTLGEKGTACTCNDDEEYVLEESGWATCAKIKAPEQGGSSGKAGGLAVTSNVKGTRGTALMGVTAGPPKSHIQKVNGYWIGLVPVVVGGTGSIANPQGPFIPRVKCMIKCGDSYCQKWWSSADKCSSELESKPGSGITYDAFCKAGGGKCI
ncbi:MAG: hypothetical protein R3257_05430 [bacterium]|nr:hypothetical protein [bacterium]